MPASAAISSIEVAAKPLRANARAAAASTCCTRSALGMRRRPRVPAIQPPTLRYQRDNTYSQVDTEEFTYRRCQRAGGWRRSQVLPPEPIQLVEPAAQLGEPLRAQRVSVTFPGRAPATVPWFDHLMRQAGRPDLIQLNASTIPYLLALVIAPTVGAVLAGRRPRHPVGWLLLALGLSVSASGCADGYARYGVAARPGAVPAARWVAIYSPATTILGLVCVGFILLLTPTGSLPSPRWRWWAWVEAAGGALFVAAATFGPLLIPPYESVHKPLALPSLESAMVVVTVLAFGITIGGLAVGAASLVVRFRRARSVERLQLRWLALAATVTGVLAAVVLVSFAIGTTTV